MLRAILFFGKKTTVQLKISSCPLPTQCKTYLLFYKYPIPCSKCFLMWLFYGVNKKNIPQHAKRMEP